MTAPTAAWQALLAPLPAEARVVRAPVAPAEVLARPEGAAIAGWEQLSVELSDPSCGLRSVLAVFDANGTLISANDHVLFRRGDDVGEAAAETIYAHESLGGRFMEDGSFAGTRWRIVNAENAAGETRELSAERAPCTPEDGRRLRELVDTLIAREG